MYDIKVLKVQYFTAIYTELSDNINYPTAQMKRFTSFLNLLFHNRSLNVTKITENVRTVTASLASRSLCFQSATQWQTITLRQRSGRQRLLLLHSKRELGHPPPPNGARRNESMGTEDLPIFHLRLQVTALPSIAVSASTLCGCAISCRISLILIKGKQTLSEEELCLRNSQGQTLVVQKLLGLKIHCIQKRTWKHTHFPPFRKTD